ncbi:MAG: hypothetical protein Q7S89_01775 [bacterium]|nr:hypothetical protein [bacterium]
MTKLYSVKKKRRARFFVTATIGVWCMIVLLFGGYLAIANDLATKGIQRGAVQRDVRAAERNSQELTLRAAQLQSLDDLGGDPIITGMVEVGSDVHYVDAGSVALR